MWAAGANANGQLGQINASNYAAPVAVLSEHRIVTLAAGLTHSLFVTDSAVALATGANTNGQLGDGSNRTNPPKEGVQLTACNLCRPAQWHLN